MKLGNWLRIFLSEFYSDWVITISNKYINGAVSLLIDLFFLIGAIIISINGYINVFSKALTVWDVIKLAFVSVVGGVIVFLQFTIIILCFLDSVEQAKKEEKRARDSEKQRREAEAAAARTSEGQTGI